MVERTWETKKSLLHTKMRNHITLSPRKVQRMKEMEWRCVDCLLARSRQPCRKPRTEAGDISTALRSGHEGPTAVLPVRLPGPLSGAFPQAPGVTELQRDPTCRACTGSLDCAPTVCAPWGPGVMTKPLPGGAGGDVDLVTA